MTRALLVFDGDCGFCAHCAAFADLRLDDDVTVLPWQALDLDEVGLSEEQVRSASYWVDEFGALAGHECVARTLLGMGMSWSLGGRLLEARLVRPLAARAYSVVVRSRRGRCASRADPM